DRESGGGEALAEPPGAGMVVREAVDVVVERIDARGRDDPRLAHRTAEEVLEPPRLPHPLARAGDQRAERAAEPLREAERDRVEATGDLGRRDPGRDRGVHEAGSVEVQMEVALAAHLGDG